jgi:DNA helicase HerA-like ATPase
MEILIGKTSDSLTPVSLPLKMANRHGLIAGATGTGKTVTLQALAEKFSRAGVSVFTADIKGDLSGICKSGNSNEKVHARVTQLQIQNFKPQGNPTTFWDLYSKSGIPIRATLSEVGPLLMARILGINETQTQVLQIIFKIADDQGLLLLDLKDLKSLMAWISENAKELKADYGNLASTTLGAIQRSVINLSDRGGDMFFGEPALKLEHIIQRDFSGNGVINVLDATKLTEDTSLYSSFLLWLLSELFEELLEVGDLEVPKLVFFFDEAHLLFRDTPPNLLTKIEQVVRLIRSKGVGVYFVTQNPADIPETVLAQLGSRIQHALRAYTPSEQKAVRAAANSFRPNPEIDTETAISELIVGEALVSVLDTSGRPQVVERVLIAPPESRIGVLSTEERAEMIARSPLRSLYETALDRESAAEMLVKRRAKDAEVEVEEAEERIEVVKTRTGNQRQGFVETTIKSILRTAGSQLGRQIMRGILGSISKR